MEKNLFWQNNKINISHRIKLLGQEPFVLWLTGLSGSGKTTLANIVEENLYSLNYLTYLLDGDNIRHGLNKDLGFSDADRKENIRRIGHVSRLMFDSAVIVVSAFISPFIKDRELVRNLMPKGRFIEVFVKCPLEVCAQRDPKNLYKKAANNEINKFTGISSGYEEPENPEIVIDTYKNSEEMSAKIIMDYLINNGYINGKRRKL